MNWTSLLISVVSALILTTLLSWPMRRSRLMKGMTQPSYEHLLQTRDAASCAFIFALVWFPMVMTRIEDFKSISGGATAYLILGLFIMVYAGFRVVFYLIDRRWPPVKAPEER